MKFNDIFHETLKLFTEQYKKIKKNKKNEKKVIVGIFLTALILLLFSTFDNISQ